MLPTGQDRSPRDAARLDAMPGSGAAGAAAAAYKDKHEQVLRIAASDVAAVAGYHEWVDIRDLFLERLLYQVCVWKKKTEVPKGAGTTKLNRR